ncbi:unnamed protein product, partial [Chrysoparadoxa australica]
MTGAPCRSRHSTYQRYGLDVEEQALKMKSFWETRKDAKSRREILKVALEEKGLQLRGDIRFCSAFIAGEDVDLEEVVGIIKLTRRLFDVSRMTWSHYYGAAERAFREALHGDGLGLEEAIQKAWKQASPR